MTSGLRQRYGRALGVGALGVALLAGGTAGAHAANSTTNTSGSAVSNTTKTTQSITVKASKAHVKAGNMVVFTGHTMGLKVGTKLTLQHEKSGKWTSLHATSMVKKGNVYVLTAKLNFKGTEHLRVTAGKVHSPTVMVKVS